MSRGLIGSVSLHVLVLMAALFGLPGMRPPDIKPVESIQVDISNITSETKVKAQSKAEEKPVDKPKPKASESIEKVKPKEKVTEEKKVAAVEPQKQEEQKKAEPEEKKEEPKKEPEKKPEPKKVEDVPLDSDHLKQMLAEEEKKEEEKKKVEEQKKKDEEKKKKAEEEKKKKAEEKKKEEEEKKRIAAEEKKKIRKLDVAELEDLLNKENDESSAPTEKKAETGTPDKGETETAGDEAESKATFRDALQARITECFSPPPASKDEGVNIQVTVDFTLNQDGTLKASPIYEPTGDPLMDAVGSAAMSAVGECGPYNFFPDGKYKGYARWRLRFDPKDAK